MYTTKSVVLVIHDVRPGHPTTRALNLTLGRDRVLHQGA